MWSEVTPPANFYFETNVSFLVGDRVQTGPSWTLWEAIFWIQHFLWVNVAWSFKKKFKNCHPDDHRDLKNELYLQSYYIFLCLSFILHKLTDHKESKKEKLSTAPHLLWELAESSCQMLPVYSLITSLYI